MNNEQLSHQRKLWVIAIGRALLPKFNFKQFSTDYDDTFVVNYDDTQPGAWRAEIKISSTVGKINRIWLNGDPFSAVCTTDRIDAIVSAINKIASDHAIRTGAARAKEEQAAQWLARQEKELAGLPELPGVNITIITSGTRAGDYNLTFEAGHPLETVNAKQIREFFKFIGKDKPKSVV